MSRSQKIIGLVYTHENQALALVTQFWCERFMRHGCTDTEIVNLQDSSGLNRLQSLLENGGVDFCFGLQGVGSRLALNDGQSLWTHYKTPFLGLHHDNPSCNIYNHFCDSPYVANLYAFGCFYDIQKRHIKSDQINERIPFEIDPYIEKGVRFQERPIRFAFLKSGKSPDVYANNINQITQPLRDAVWTIVAKAEKDENLVICDLLADAFRACGHDYTQFWAEFWGFADWIDNYLRCKRAAELVNWLKFQDGAVIVGNGWDFIDKDKARAVFKPSLPADEAMLLYPQTRFMFNTSPYGSDIIHERIFIGLSHYNYVVSDTNAWWDEHFSNVPSLCRFRWGEDFGSQIMQAVGDPEAAAKAESGIGAQRVREKLTGQTQIAKILSAAAKVRDFAQARPAAKL